MLYGRFRSIDQPGFCRKDMFVEPLLQRQVIGISPEHGHRHMCVGVDKTGKHKHALCISIFRIVITGVFFANVSDFAVFYHDIALWDDIQLRIHSDDMGVVMIFRFMPFVEFQY